MVHDKALFADALTFKMIPFFFALLLFLLFSEFSPIDSSDIWDNPTNAIIGFFFTILFASFLWESRFALPDHEGTPGGIFASMLVLGLAIASGILALGFYFEFISVDNLTGEVNFLFTIFLGLAMFLYIFASREQIFHAQRAHEAFKSA